MSPFAFISTYLDSLVKYGQRNIKKSVFVEKSNHSFLDQPEKTNLTSLDLEREKLVIVKAEYHVKEPAKIEKSIVQDALVSAYQNNLKVHTLADIDDFCIKLPESITTRQSVSTQTNKPVIQFVSNGNVYAAIAVYSGVEQVNGNTYLGWNYIKDFFGVLNRLHCFCKGHSIHFGLRAVQK